MGRMKMLVMKNISYFLMLSLMAIVSPIWGQSPADSLTFEQVERLREIAELKGKWDFIRGILTVLLPILGFLLGAFFSYLGVKNRILRWAEEEVTKKASEKFGLDWGIVKKLVDEEKRMAAIIAKKVAVVNTVGKYLTLSNEIEKHGFSTEDYRKLEILPDDLDINACQLLVLDNSNGDYKEEDVVRFFDNMQEKIKIVYLATEDLSDENFKKYKSSVRIIKLMERLGVTLLNLH